MAKSNDQRPRNISWADGSPIEFLADSPHLVVLDQLDLGSLSILFTPALLAKPAREALLELLELTDGLGSMGFAHYEIADFTRGFYRLEVNDICAIGDEDDLSDEEWERQMAEGDQDALRYFGVDSGTIVLVGFNHLKRLAELLTDEQFDAACRAHVDDYSIFLDINKSLGGPYYAVIVSPGEPFEFCGDGTYTLQKGAIKLVKSSPR